MRNRTQFYEMLKEHDPHTAITPNMIYQKIRSGEWPTVRVGNKALLNVDVIFSILENPQSTATQELQSAKIRRIGEI